MLRKLKNQVSCITVTKNAKGILFCNKYTLQSHKLKHKKILKYTITTVLYNDLSRQIHCLVHKIHAQLLKLTIICTENLLILLRIQPAFLTI